MEPQPEPRVKLSVVIDGASFSSEGPQSFVLRQYADWQSLSGLEPEPKRKGPTFNAPRLMSQRP